MSQNLCFQGVSLKKCSGFGGKMSESALLFSSCKFEEGTTSNSGCEGKMSESELVFSRLKLEELQ